jgi:hypothetical protein
MQEVTLFSIQVPDGKTIASLEVTDWNSYAVYLIAWLEDDPKAGKRKGAGKLAPATFDEHGRLTIPVAAPPGPMGDELLANPEIIPAPAGSTTRSPIPSQLSGELPPPSDPEPTAPYGPPGRRAFIPLGTPALPSKPSGKPSRNPPAHQPDFLRVIPSEPGSTPTSDEP